MHNSRILLAMKSLATVVCGGMWFFQHAIAQESIRSNVTIVVPYPAGGGNDLFARLLASKLRTEAGGRVIVENRTGASGNIGTASVLRAPADGNTLLYAASTLAINGWVNKDISFDAGRDLRAVTITLSIPFVLAVHPSLPVSSTKTLIDFSKKRAGEVTFSSGGVGSANHFAMEAFKLKTGADLRHIPYRGAAPALTALVSGETQASFLVPPLVIPNLNNGKLRALGISSATRLKILPNIPPLQEVGAPGFQALQWHGFFVSAKTPTEIVQRLRPIISEALNSPDLTGRIESAGATRLDLDTERSQTFFLDEIKYWGGVVKGARLN
jgi:tripartite-type tricarboxylate transporter receptor subunit TctC